jgi:hypothetical protein
MVLEDTGSGDDAPAANEVGAEGNAAEGGRVADSGSTTGATYTIGGTLDGLRPGRSITLQDNGNDSVVVAANGVFAFSAKLASGSAYDVTILVRPPGEMCAVTGGTGTVGSANVTDVAVSCH